jgi:GDP-L-fucose synthase
VLPSLIHKLYLAKKENKPFKIWGNGSASREFLYSEDLARMLLKIIDMEDIPSRIIISGDKQFTIKQVVEMLCEVSEFKGEVIWETDKPNGQKARPTDLSVLKSLLGKIEYTDIKSALHESYNWFATNYPEVRI